MRVLLVLPLLVLPAFAEGEFNAFRVKQKLHDAWEPTVREAARACAEADTVEAVELLLLVLRRTARFPPHALAAAHYRDIVWDALVQIRNPYARKRIERELKENRRNARVRQWCAELLGIYRDATFAPALVEALADPDADVRRWAARSLGRLRYGPAAESLARLVDAGNRFVRANAIEALARIDAARHKDRLLAAARTDPDGGVRCALLGAVAAHFPGETVRLSAAALRDADWRPRLRAVANLAAVKTKPSVDALVEATGDTRPAVSHRAETALRRLTGKEILGVASWRGWWAANRATFAFPELEGEARGTDRARRTVAYGVPLTSDHVAFVLDKSLPMKETMKATGTSKDKAALKELQRVLAKMRGRLTFNVYLYRESVRAFRPRPSPCEFADMRTALRFVKTHKPKGAKDIWQVLEKAVSDPQIDTVYLLSSGEPDVGLYVHWNRVTRHLKDLNRFENVTVHTIVYSGKQWYRDQLEKIATATGGEFRGFE